MNTTIDEIEDIVFGIVETVDKEIETIDQNFNTFVDDLLVKIKMDNITGNIDSIAGLLTSYEDIAADVSQTMDTINRIEDIAENIKNTCSQTLLPTQCDELQSITDVLISLPIVKLPTLDENLVNEVSNLQTIIKNVTYQIENVNITGLLSQLSDEVDTIYDDVTEELAGLDEIQSDIFRGTEIQDQFETIYDQYLVNINYGFLAIGGLLAWILTCIWLPMLCGCSAKQFGRAKVSYSLFFLSAVVLFLLCTGLFTIGAISQKLVCDPLDDPENNSEMIDLVDPMLNVYLNSAFNNCTDTKLRGTGRDTTCPAFNLSIPVIIKGVHQGLPLYPLLQLNNIYDIENLENWKEEFDINSIIDSTLQSLNDIVDDITQMEENIPKEDIINLVTNLDNSLNPILSDLMNPDLINNPIENANSTLKSIIDTITGSAPAEFIKLLEQLMTQISHLQASVITIQQDFQEILITFGDENSNLNLTRFTKSTFDLVSNAFKIIPGEVDTFVNTTIDQLLLAVDEEIDEVIVSVNAVGGTEPLSAIYNSTYVHLCLEIVAPLNSVWSGLGWTLVLLLLPLSLLLCLVTKTFPSRQPAVAMRPWQPR